MMSIEAMKRALEYLQENEGCIADVSSSQYVKEYYEFMERFAGVIKQAEQQEPVAWINKSRNLLSWDKFYADMTPLYTAPVDGVTISEERVDEMVKTEHDKQIELAQAYERGWNAALAQQEPVAWISEGGDVSRSKRYMDEMGFKCNPLYTAPPKKEWVGLTADEVPDPYKDDGIFIEGWLWAEEKLKEKNT